MSAVKIFQILALLVIFSFLAIGCGGGGDSTTDDSRGDDDDDGYDPIDDDDDDDDTSDDDDDTSDDDDDSTNPWIEILVPLADATIPARSVFIQGEFNLLVEANITICERIDIDTCTDYTDQFTFEEDTFYGSIEFPEGTHTLEAKGIFARAESVTDQVTFLVDVEGPHIDLTLTSYAIETGETISASYVVYDEDDNDITSQVTVDLQVSPSLGVVENLPDYTFMRNGQFKVEASTIWESQWINDYRFVNVEAGDAYRIEITASDDDINAGNTITLSADVFDENDDPVYTNVFYNVAPPFGTEIGENNGFGQVVDMTLKRAGVLEITGTVVGSSVSDTINVTVHPGNPYRMNLTILEPEVYLESTQVTIEPVVEILDIYNNIVPDAPFTLSILPDNGVNLDQVNHTVTFTDAITADMFVVSGQSDDYPATVYDSATVFVVKNRDLDIIFYNPPRGYVAENPNSSLDVSGLVPDCDPSEDEMYINDTLVTLSGSCEFTKNYSMHGGLNIYNARVENNSEIKARGSTSALYGTFFEDDVFINNSIWVGLTENGFNTIGDVVNNLITDMNIPDMLMAMNPLFDEDYEVWGVTLATARAEVTAVTMGDLTIDFNILPLGTYLSTLVRMNDIRLDFKVRGHILGIGYSVTGYVATEWVELDTNAEIGVVGNNLYVNMETLDVAIEDLDIDINNFPDELIGLFESTIEGIIEDVVSDALQDEVPDLLTEVLNEIPMDYTFDVTLPDGTDANANFAVRPATVSSNDNGDAMTFIMQSRFMLDAVSSLPPVMPGSIRTSSTAPDSFGQYIWGTSNDYEMGMYLGDDILNQALYNIYRAGALSLDYDQAFATDDTGIGLLLPAAIISTYPHNDVNLKFRPLLPPVILVGEGGRSVPARVQMGDMMLHMFVVDDLGDEVLILSAAVSFDAAAAIDIVFPDNTLSISLSNPDAVLDVVSEPVADFNNDLFEGLGPFLVEMLLPIIENFLGEIQIPTFSGYGAQVLQAFPIGPQADYISIWLDLIAPE